MCNKLLFANFFFSFLSTVYEKIANYFLITRRILFQLWFIISRSNGRNSNHDNRILEPNGPFFKSTRCPIVSEILGKRLQVCIDLCWLEFDPECSYTQLEQIRERAPFLRANVETRSSEIFCELLIKFHFFVFAALSKEVIMHCSMAAFWCFFMCVFLFPWIAMVCMFISLNFSSHNLVSAGSAWLRLNVAVIFHGKTSLQFWWNILLPLRLRCCWHFVTAPTFCTTINEMALNYSQYVWESRASKKYRASCRIVQ